MRHDEAQIGFTVLEGQTEDALQRGPWWRLQVTVAPNSPPSSLGKPHKFSYQLSSFFRARRVPLSTSCIMYEDALLNCLRRLTLTRMMSSRIYKYYIIYSNHLLYCFPLDRAFSISNSQFYENNVNKLTCCHPMSS